MPKRQTEFYDRASGCHFRVTWASERIYREGIAFLDRVTGGSFGRVSEPDGPDFHIMEIRQQLDAALAFKRRLEGGGYIMKPRRGRTE